MSNMFYGEEMNIAAVHRASAIKKSITILFAAAIVGLFIDNLPMLVYGGVLVSMGKACDSYKTAGICLLASCILGIVSGMIFEEGGFGSLLLTVPAAVLGLLAEYSEIQGHAEMLVGIDNEQSTKWEQLWKYMVIAYGILIGSIVVLVILPVIGALAALAATIAVLITSIMKIVYLYRMDNTLKKLV